MTILFLLQICVGWHCGSPYGEPPPIVQITKPMEVGKVYIEIGTGCMIRMEHPQIPSYLPIIVGKAVDEEICKGKYKSFWITEIPKPWSELKVEGK